MTYGLVAAIAWGISTIAAANAARRIGTYCAVLVSQVLGLTVLGILVGVLHPSLSVVGVRAVVGLAAAGVLALLGWLLYYRALERGPVGVVSAIGASYGGVTVLLAVTLLGERIGGIGGAGAVLAVGGVALSVARPPGAAPDAVGAHAVGSESASGRGPAAATRGGHRRASHRRASLRPGIPLALASALIYGIGAFLLGRFSAGAGWLPSTLVAYGASVTTLVLALPFLRGRRALRSSPRGLAWAAVAGLTEVVALLAFSRGGQVGQVAITAAVSSLYPAFALAGGILVFRERLSRRQALGVGCIAAGVVLLGLT